MINPLACVKKNQLIPKLSSNDDYNWHVRNHNYCHLGEDIQKQILNHYINQLTPYSYNFRARLDQIAKIFPFIKIILEEANGDGSTSQHLINYMKSRNLHPELFFLAIRINQLTFFKEVIVGLTNTNKYSDYTGYHSILNALEQIPFYPNLIKKTKSSILENLLTLILVLKKGRIIRIIKSNDYALIGALDVLTDKRIFVKLQELLNYLPLDKRLAYLTRKKNNSFPLFYYPNNLLTAILPDPAATITNILNQYINHNLLNPYSNEFSTIKTIIYQATKSNFIPHHIIKTLISINAKLEDIFVFSLHINQLRFFSITMELLEKNPIKRLIATPSLYFNLINKIEPAILSSLLSLILNLDDPLIIKQLLIEDDYALIHAVEELNKKSLLNQPSTLLLARLDIDQCFHYLTTVKNFSLPLFNYSDEALVDILLDFEPEAVSLFLTRLPKAPSLSIEVPSILHRKMDGRFLLHNILFLDFLLDKFKDEPYLLTKIFNNRFRKNIASDVIIANKDSLTHLLKNKDRLPVSIVEKISQNLIIQTRAQKTTWIPLNDFNEFIDASSELVPLYEALGNLENNDDESTQRRTSYFEQFSTVTPESSHLLLLLIKNAHIAALESLLNHIPHDSLIKFYSEPINELPLIFHMVACEFRLKSLLNALTPDACQDILRLKTDMGETLYVYTVGLLQLILPLSSPRQDVNSLTEKLKTSARYLLSLHKHSPQKSLGNMAENEKAKQIIQHEISRLRRSKFIIGAQKKANLIEHHYQIAVKSNRSLKDYEPLRNALNHDPIFEFFGIKSTKNSRAVIQLNTLGQTLDDIIHAEIKRLKAEGKKLLRFGMNKKAARLLRHYNAAKKYQIPFKEHIPLLKALKNSHPLSFLGFKSDESLNILSIINNVQHKTFLQTPQSIIHSEILRLRDQGDDSWGIGNHKKADEIEQQFNEATKNNLLYKEYPPLVNALNQHRLFKMGKPKSAEALERLSGRKVFTFTMNTIP